MFDRIAHYSITPQAVIRGRDDDEDEYEAPDEKEEFWWKRQGRWRGREK